MTARLGPFAIIALAALAFAVPASSRTEARTATTISGTITLQAVDVTQRCAFAPGSKTTTVVRKVRKAVWRKVRGKRKKVFAFVRKPVRVTVPLLNARCGQAGQFQGQPAVAGAAYNWP
ncbi:MAG: hypothetical protein M3540_04260 [Actinomycetota bacterium]|nr:hypothetical protein [Actinomycetota bacterium]